MNAISICQPWAWAIAHGPKRVENRLYQTVHRGELAASGFRIRYDCMPASAIGANHRRDRLWILAYTKSDEYGLATQSEARRAAEKGDSRIHQRKRPKGQHSGAGRSRSRARIPNSRKNKGGFLSLETTDITEADHGRQADAFITANSDTSRWWATEPDVGRVADGVAARVDRLRAIGNGQVPAVDRLAWEILGRMKG